MNERQKNLADTADSYARYFQTLSPEHVEQVLPLVSEDIHFIDPFNDIRGREALVQVIRKMFEDVKDPSFDILDLAWSGEMCLMRWDFSARVPVLGDWTVRGVTEIQFDGEGQICAHYDYWDASRHFYGKIPLIGSVIRAIARKAQIRD